MNKSTGTKWPKVFPPLTEEQQKISDDFMKYWHEVLPARYGMVDAFGHHFAVRQAPAQFTRTLEIGAGLGEHLAYEKLTPEQEAGYCAVDIRANMVARMKERFPRIQAVVADAQERLDFPDGHFDRILAIHVLEHLPDLPRAVREMHRLCRPETGCLTVVIPCEGGMMYGLARKISAQRIFEKRYGQSYRWFIEREHLNRPAEILAELAPWFEIRQSRSFPLFIPSVALNFVMGFNLRPRRSSTASAGGDA